MTLGHHSIKRDISAVKDEVSLTRFLQKGKIVKKIQERGDVWF